MLHQIKYDKHAFRHIDAFIKGRHESLMMHCDYGGSSYNNSMGDLVVRHGMNTQAYLHSENMTRTTMIITNVVGGFSFKIMTSYGVTWVSDNPKSSLVTIDSDMIRIDNAGDVLRLPWRMRSVIDMLAKQYVEYKEKL